LLSVATAAQGFTTFVGVLPAFAFHGVCALAGSQLVGRQKAKQTPHHAEAAA